MEWKSTWKFEFKRFLYSKKYFNWTSTQFSLKKEVYLFFKSHDFSIIKYMLVYSNTLIEIQFKEYLFKKENIAQNPTI